MSQNRKHTAQNIVRSLLIPPFKLIVRSQLILPFPMVVRSKVLLPLVLVVMLSSCAVSDTVVSRHFSDQPAKAKQLSHVGKTHWSYFWGLLKQDEWRAECQSGSHMSRVRVKTNPGFIIVSFLSLGIAVPQKLEWDCSPPARDEGEIGTDSIPAPQK